MAEFCMERRSKLSTYAAKRDFTRTREPVGARGRNREISEHLFVIQKHAARRLHYDFRLAMENVLRSWAVPKGLPVEQGDRRLAVHVEDHPLEYANFEGTIPKGEYGGGTVMVWDFGTYRVIDGDPVAGYKSGKLHLELNGKKLKGQWALVRGRRRDEEKSEPWFLIKTGASARPISARRDDQSAVTGRTMKQIASEKPVS
jgi:bifunctional non-homologous end joining protein LigD